jgi:hypothetical protein
MQDLRSIIRLIENTSERLDETHMYGRVIPRDLFNEANLLKCYGKLYIEIENSGLPDVELVHRNPGSPFLVSQDQNSGDLTIANVILMVRGAPCALRRPLNARDAWPLYADTGTGDEIDVFTSSGALSPEMHSFLSG